MPGLYPRAFHSRKVPLRQAPGVQAGPETREMDPGPSFGALATGVERRAAEMPIKPRVGRAPLLACQRRGDKCRGAFDGGADAQLGRIKDDGVLRGQ